MALGGYLWILMTSLLMSPKGSGTMVFVAMIASWEPCNMTKYSKHQLHLLEHPYHVMYVLPICMLFSRTHVLSKVIELTKSTNVLSPNVFIKIFHTFLPSALPPTQHTQKLNANILTQSQSHPKKQSGTKFWKESTPTSRKILASSFSPLQDRPLRVDMGPL